MVGKQPSTCIAAEHSDTVGLDISKSTVVEQTAGSELVCLRFFQFRSVQCQLNTVQWGSTRWFPQGHPPRCETISLTFRV